MPKAGDLRFRLHFQSRGAGSDGFGTAVTGPFETRFTVSAGHGGEGGWGKCHGLAARRHTALCGDGAPVLANPASDARLAHGGCAPAGADLQHSLNS